MSHAENSGGRMNVTRHAAVRREQNDTTEPSHTTLMSYLRAKLMLGPHRRVQVERALQSGRSSAELALSQINQATDDTVTHGAKAREQTMPFMSSIFDLGPITQDELEANDAIRRRACARKQFAAAEVPAHSATTSEANLLPKGRPITPEEFARAMGAKILGRSYNH